jgi:diguanylate cyclase (GGDEF)-like protein
MSRASWRALQSFMLSVTHAPGFLDESRTGVELTIAVREAIGTDLPVTVWTTDLSGQRWRNGYTVRPEGAPHHRSSSSSASELPDAPGTPVPEPVKAFQYSGIRGPVWAVPLPGPSGVLGLIAVDSPELPDRTHARLTTVAPWAAAAVAVWHTQERLQLSAAFSDVLGALSSLLGEQTDWSSGFWASLLAVLRQRLELDRVLLLSVGGRRRQISVVAQSGGAHLWLARPNGPLSRSALLARLSDSVPGTAADGLVAWWPVVADETQLVLLAENLLSEQPVPYPAHASWNAVAELLAGGWRLRRQLTEATRQASHDPLTGLLNRQAGWPLIEAAVHRSRAVGIPATLVVLDVDGFKAWNDRYGHLVGDTVLKAVGAWLSTHLRAEDIAVRYGGDEFLLLLPEISAVDQPQVLDRLVGGLGHLKIRGDAEPPTVSIGAAVAPWHGTDPQALFDAADRALYRAKWSGGNAWQIAEGEGPDRAPIPFVARAAMRRRARRG